MVILALQKGVNPGPSGHEFHNFNKRPYEHYNYEFNNEFLSCMRGVKEAFEICIFGSTYGALGMVDP